MRRILLLLSITICNLFFLSNLSAKQVPIDLAKQAALGFLKENSSVAGSYTINSLSLAYESKSDATSTDGEIIPETYFYIFNIGNNNGIIIISGDDLAIPILGYTEKGSYDSQTLPPQFVKWLENYKDEIRYAIYNLKEDPSTLAIWERYENARSSRGVKKTSVGPLMSTTWNQSPHYNEYCPYDNSAGERTVTGCVATAMAQIMKFWNYPAKGTGFHSYNHSDYGTLSANFGATTYNWAGMPNNVSSTNSAVATLMFHVGVSVDMNYGPGSTGGSGAYVITSASPVLHCSEHALKTYWGYTDVQGKLRSNYTLSSWISLLKTELDGGKPILYAGFGSGGGHCFVADGYDNSDNFHMNWGWGGYYDGFFPITALNPGGVGTGGGTGGFNSGHQAVIGFKPPTTSTTYNLKLYDDVTASPTTVNYGQGFTIHNGIRNTGTGSFTGDYTAAAFDANGNFVDYIQTYTSQTLGAGSYYPTGVDFTTAGLTSLLPGTYRIYTYYKPTGGNWIKLEDPGNFTSYVDVTIIQTATGTIELNSNLSVSPGTTLTQHAPASVTFDLLNNSGSMFSALFDISLYDQNGDYINTIDYQNLNICASCQQNNITFSTSDLDVLPGTYLLALIHSQDGGYTYELTGSNTYSNPIYVTVVEPTLSGDIYETNNTAGTAYNLPLSFASNKDTIITTGSNMHVGNDYDYYKIVLSAGYDYDIDIHAQDSYYSDDGNTYTNDILFSYSTDGGSSWSTSYDDLMPSSIQVNGGGTVHFFVSPYFTGETGTYVLDMKITRNSASTISADSYEPNNSIGTAYNLPANFSGSTANIVTSGANLHTASDPDFYKMVLSGGYNYVIDVRAQDSWSSDDGNAYTNDIFFTYSTDGGTNWAAYYDDVLPSTIQINGGGTILFYIAPYFAGGTGTYALDATVTRTAATSSVAGQSLNKTIEAYPNPTTGILHLDATDNVQNYEVYDAKGKLIAAELNTSNFVNISKHEAGVYILKLFTKEGVAVKQIVKQ